MINRNLSLLDHCTGYNIDSIKKYEVGGTYFYNIIEIDENKSLLEIRMNSDEFHNMKLFSVLFDGYHMVWYGQYYPLVFDCTWKTNLVNIPFNNPHYLLGKLDNNKIKDVFDSSKNSIIKNLKDGSWFEEDLNDDQREEILEWAGQSWRSGTYSISFYDEWEEEIDALDNLLDASEEECTWICACRDLDEEMCNQLFGCEYYDLFDWGRKPPQHFFYLLYVLSLIAEDYTKKIEEQEKETKQEC